MSWVGQNPQLFHGTLRENICLAAPMATEQQITSAIQTAYADEFIGRLEKGLDHPVGDRATGLSVGQAQRIAVARALLQNGHFWLLDEPTASLDASSERLVMESLNHATRDTTTLLVSHRIDQLGGCNHILVMQKGQLVQQGTFEALKQEGVFAEMIQAVDRSDLDA